jgi:hypothetical protein
MSPRPGVADILTPEALRSVASDAGMSELEIAEAFVPGGGFATHFFYVSMKGGEAVARRLGLRCRKSATLSLGFPYATAVRSLFFTLSDLRYGPIEATDTAEGCHLRSQLPSDHLSFAGTLDFQVIERADRVDIVGTSTIGQLFDWGKGLKTLGNVFRLTETLARRIEGTL